MSRVQVERAAAAAARNVNAYGQKEEGPSRWQERKELKRQMYLMSTEKHVQVGVRKSDQKSQANGSQCQQCFQPGHWTYECKNERIYMVRPSRSQQLKNPKLRPKPLDPSEVRQFLGVEELMKMRDKEKSERERRRSRKKRGSRKSDSSESGSSSEDDSELDKKKRSRKSRRQDSSSDDSQSASESDSDSEDERDRKSKKSSSNKRKRYSSSSSSSSGYSTSDSESSSSSEEEDAKKSRKKKSRK